MKSLIFPGAHKILVFLKWISEYCPERQEIQNAGAGVLSTVEFIDWMRAQGRSSLSEAESKSLLNRYGVPVVQEAIAFHEDEAAVLSESIGFPVVLKGLGKNITHKT